MKDQLIKLHDEFVGKGMPPLTIITNRNKDLWLRPYLIEWIEKKHDILVYADPIKQHTLQYRIVTQDNEIIGSETFDNWEQAIEKALQEAIKLIE